MARCRHVWLIVLDQAVTVLLECEQCRALVAVAVDRRPGGGHAFMFGLPRDTDRRLVSDADLQALGDWFAHQVGEPVMVHAPMGKRARRRRAARTV